MTLYNTMAQRNNYTWLFVKLKIHAQVEEQCGISLCTRMRASTPYQPMTQQNFTLIEHFPRDENSLSSWL